MPLSNEGRLAIEKKIATFREERGRLLNAKQTLIGEFEKAKKKKDELIARMTAVDTAIAALQADLV